MSMKRIKEWAELCSDDTIRQQWIDNANALNLIEWNSNIMCESMDEALFNSFYWRESPQTHGYWGEIHAEMLYNPDKYLNKRKVMFHEYEE